MNQQNNFSQASQPASFQGVCVSVQTSKLELEWFDAEDIECRSFVMTLAGCQQYYQCLRANQ